MLLPLLVVVLLVLVLLPLLLVFLLGEEASNTICNSCRLRSSFCSWVASGGGASGGAKVVVVVPNRWDG